LAVNQHSLGKDSPINHCQYIKAAGSEPVLLRP
jgi:hypothetical protein